MSKPPCPPQSNRCSNCGRYVGATFTAYERDRFTDRGKLLCDDCLQQHFMVLVKSIRPIAGEGNLRAFAAVQIGPITVNSVRVIQQPGQAAYVAGPQEKDAQGHWRHLVKFTDERIKQQVRTAVLAAWKEQTK